MAPVRPCVSYPSASAPQEPARKESWAGADGHAGKPHPGSELDASSRQSIDTPVPSLRPSAAPTPVAVPRRKRAPRVGDIGWAFATTEGDFVSHLDSSQTAEIEKRANLHLHHIPAELKREYKLEGFYGLQNLPTPDAAALHALPLSPAVDKRFHRRFGAGCAALSDLVYMHIYM
jgi:hypothetical protein